MNNSLLKYSGLLLLGLLLEWWIVWFSPLNLPERIYLGFLGDAARPSLKIDGVLLVGLLLTILIFAQKEFLRKKPEMNILKLTIYGASICFISEIVFQALRQQFIDANAIHTHLYYFLVGTIGVSIFGLALSFFIAFQLKTKKTAKLILLIVVFGIVIQIVKYFFSVFFDSK